MIFLKTLLVILLIYFGVKFLFRLLTPYLLRMASRKMDERFQSMFGEYSHQDPTRTSQEEGEVSIDKIPKQSPKSKNKVGEYIEYEEIE